MFTEIKILLETTFGTAWANECPVAYENVPFRQPAGEFVRFNVIEGDGHQLSLGVPKLERQFGVIMLQIFTPKNSGTKRANQLADRVADIFRMKQFTNGGLTVNCRTPKKNPVGSRPDYHQAVLEVPYEANQLF